MKLGFLLILGFLLVLASNIPLQPRFDYKFHYAMSGMEICPDPYVPTNCESYPYLSLLFAIGFYYAQIDIYNFFKRDNEHMTKECRDD